MGAALAYAAYRHAEIDTMSQRDLLVKMFESMERNIDAGAMAMANRSYERSTQACRRIRDILFELVSTLNMDKGGVIALQLKQLYVFLIDQVTEASLRKNAEQLRQLKRVISPLREGWQGIPDELANLSSAEPEASTSTSTFSVLR